MAAQVTEEQFRAGQSSNANVAKIAIEQQKKKTDVVEPQVISEELLIEGVEEPKREDIEVWKPIDFPMVTSQRLSFKNIIEIANLNNFDALTTLRLDNNIIDKIENLGHLKQLTWLDLSFNNIREIEGLDELTNLLDLSLYNNQIDEIKGLDGCTKLNILSLGHNNIADLKQIDYLRRFKNLRCLCMDNNKVCQMDSYSQHVLAYLPTLKYLDYQLIDPAAFKTASESYNQDELTEVREKEQAQAVKAKQAEEKQVIINKLKNSFLDCTEDLFEDFFEKDVPDHLTVLNCYPTLKDEFREKLAEDVKSLRQVMEDKNRQRLKKVVSFEKSIAIAEKDSEEEAFNMVRDFRTVKKKVLAQVERAEGDALKPEHEAMLKQLEEQLQRLEHHLMQSEINLQESIWEAIGDFEVKISDIMKIMTERGSEFFRRLEDIEKEFYGAILEQGSQEIEAFNQASDNVAADMDPLKAKYLGNKEEMMQAFANFAEAHTTLIQNKDDYMSSQMANWQKNFSDKHRDNQYKRNRQRITDIKKVIDDCRAEMQAAAEVGEDYDDGDGDFGR